MKHQYIKPELRVVELQNQCHILAGSNGKYSQDYYEVRSFRSGPLNYCGGDDDFEEDAR